MDEIIERVARAICKAEIPDAPYDDKEWTNFNRDHWHAAARAAIEAMRLPTDAMIESADRNVRPDSDNLQCPNWYTAAIDAALSTPLASEGGTK